MQSFWGKNWHVISNLSMQLSLIQNITKDVHNNLSELSSTSFPQSLSSLCQQWQDVREDSLPGICHQFITQNDDHLKTIILNHHASLDGDVLRHGFATGRNISIAAILAGVLFILLIIAIILRLRQSKLVQV